MKVLVADDDAASLALAASILEDAGHEVVLAKDGEYAKSKLAEGDYDMALLDWMMPGIDGMTLCREVREWPSEKYLYILLITGKGETKDVIAGLESGADHYLVKPFHPAELKARVQIARRFLELESRLRSENKQWTALALQDEATGVPNRRAVLQRLEEEAGRSVREGWAFSIILLDIDGFKHINDTYGHYVGDAMLKEFARRIGENLRCSDAFGRFGGDEFLILLPGLTQEQALAIGERLRASVTENPFCLETGGALLITGSFGVAQIDPTLPLDKLIPSLDQALYRAKRAGGNCIRA